MRNILRQVDCRRMLKALRAPHNAKAVWTGNLFLLCSLRSPHRLCQTIRSLPVKWLLPPSIFYLQILEVWADGRSSFEGCFIFVCSVHSVAVNPAFMEQTVWLAPVTSSLYVGFVFYLRVGFVCLISG